MRLVGTFDDQKQGVVNATGDLTVSFMCPLDQQWSVTQVSFEMLTAPSGSTATLRKQNVLIAPAFSARKAAIGGDPPVPLRPGETISIVWDGCTSGDIGLVYILYDKYVFTESLYL